MTTDVTPLFRLTAWPPEPLPVPALLVYPVRLTEGGFLERDLSGTRPKGGQRGRAVTVPDELYLRGLRELDLDDRQQVAAFVGEYGPLGTPGWSDLPEPHAAHEPVYFEGAPVVRPNFRAVLEDKYDRYLSERNLSHRPPGLTHVDDFGVYARLLRDLVRILEAHQGLLTLFEVEGGWESRWVTPEVWRDGGIREAVAFMADCLRLAMGPYFYARLEIREEPWPDDDLLAAVPSLYAVLCLQMWNHIAEQTPYRICKRTDCGRLFVRQQGRAKYGQSRKTGVDYCSARCARLVAVRKYRDDHRQASE